MGRQIPDEVWQQLDPNAGRLSRRTAARMWIAFVLVLAVIGAGLLTWRSGLIAPRLIWPNTGWAWEQTADGVARVQVTIANGGKFPVTLVDAGRSGPGLNLLGAEGPLPARLQPDDEVVVVLVYRITDCAAAPRGPWPVMATAQRPWGTMTVAVAPVLDFQYWQEAVVEAWCDP